MLVRREARYELAGLRCVREQGYRSDCSRRLLEWPFPTAHNVWISIESRLQGLRSRTIMPKVRRNDQVAVASAVSASVNGARTAGSNVGMTIWRGEQKTKRGKSNGPYLDPHQQTV